MKKLLTGIVAGFAILAVVGTASAATYTINQCGASAQAGFWEASGAAVVQAAFGCASAELDGVGDKNMVIGGFGCDVGAGTAPDTVYVRYQVVNSSYGCTNHDCELSSGWANPATCTFDGTPYDCTGTEDANCQIGCADVACEEITATTFGYEDGRAGSPVGGGSDPFILHGNAAGFTTSADTFYGGVVIPFGFIVNNSVTDHYCNYAGLSANAHLAYDKTGWECDPDDGDDTNPHDGVLSCRGDYKCIDTDESGTGVCMDGNQDADLDATISAAETECVDASDCKMAANGEAGVGPSITVTCDADELKNVSRLMVLHIFSDQVSNWADFGPSFNSLPIVKCARHGGSGTHQTLLDTVFRGDAIFKNVTALNSFWHYKSSSDLTRDCVAFYDGGIGYVDADKVMFRSKIADGIHQLMYQGVAPSRHDVANGKYNFWSAQQCFLDSTAGCYGPQDLAIIDAIQTKAGDPTFLTFAGFGQRAYFWATQDEMQVEKTSGIAYPTRK